nr:MAG TPA_asm: hypothetical protein [Caudoviricetes sp.]
MKSKARVSGFFYGGSAASWSSGDKCMGLCRDCNCRVVLNRSFTFNKIK